MNNENQNQQEILNQVQDDRPLGERFDNWYEKKNTFRAMNGLTEMTADINATLVKLTEVVQPATPNLAAIIRTSVANYGTEGMTLEKMWADKLAEGANVVAVVDGVFGFYKDKEKLADPTRILRVPVLPPIYELRNEERFVVLGRVKLELENLKKEMGR